MTDFVTPGFRRKSNRGEIIFSPMSWSRYRYTGTSTDCEYVFTPPAFVAPGTLAVYRLTNLFTAIVGPLKPPVHPTVPTGHLMYNWMPLLDEDFHQSRAATAALADSNGKSAQGLVIIAEMQKTLNTLRNPLASMRKLLTQAPKIVRARGQSLGQKAGNLSREAAGDLSSQYLAWFYGIRTVMFDIEEVMEALETRISNRVTGRGRSTDETSTDTDYSADITDSYVNYRITYTEKLEMRAGALVILESIPSVQQNLGLSVRKVPEAVWELIPWSFVVDWFVNVQSYIGALEAIVSNTFAAQWVVRKRTVSWTRRVTSHVMKAGWPSRYISLAATDHDAVVVEMYDRYHVNLASSARPSVHLSLKKVPTLAAISLVVQQLTKR